MKGIEIQSEETRLVDGAGAILRVFLVGPHLVFAEVVFLEGLGVVDGALRISLGGRSDMEGGHWPADLLFPNIDILETVGGVGGGESNLGDAELEIFPFSFCFIIDAAFLPQVVLSISTSSKVRSSPGPP